MATKRQAKARSSSAAGQYYGYAVVQEARFLYHLLEARVGEVVALEHLDDVSVEGNDAPTAEQNKSGLTQNPVSDRSVDLWKTFYNWLEGLRDGSLSPDTNFVLYVAQDHSGDVVERLGNCHSWADATFLVGWLRREYWGDAPNYELKAANPASLRKYLDPVLNAKDEVLAQIITRFRFVKGRGVPYDEVRTLLKAKALGDDALAPTLENLIGWVKQRIAKCIEDRRPAAISQGEFHQQLLACARKFDRADKELIAAQVPISDAEVQAQLRSRTFVNQMKLVDLAQDELTDAVVEYLRAAADRTDWSLKGYVLEQSFDEYQAELTKAWRRKRLKISTELLGKPEKTIGQSLYLSCMELRQPLQRMEVPDHFTPGSFHALSDDKKVGWHPRFADLLDNIESVKDKHDNAE